MMVGAGAQAMVGRLPVVTQGLSDSWVMGMASDPVKTSQIRAISRALTHFTQQLLPTDDWGTQLESSAMAAFANFTRQFIKSGEHTWVGEVVPAPPLKNKSSSHCLCCYGRRPSRFATDAS